MAPKSLSWFLVICSILLASASIEASFAGWQTISNLRDPKVVEMAEFAIKQHNMRVNSMLGLVSVVEGETQMVNGLNYRLVICARDALAAAAAEESDYRVVVRDKPGKIKERQLTSFDKIAE